MVEGVAPLKTYKAKSSHTPAEDEKDSLKIAENDIVHVFIRLFFYFFFVKKVFGWLSDDCFFLEMKRKFERLESVTENLVGFLMLLLKNKELD